MGSIDTLPQSASSFCNNHIVRLHRTHILALRAAGVASTLRVILKAVKQINQKRGKVALCSLNGYVKEMFEGNCFQDTFAIADSVESGIQNLLSLNAA